LLSIHLFGWLISGGTVGFIERYRLGKAVDWTQGNTILHEQNLRPETNPSVVYLRAQGFLLQLALSPTPYSLTLFDNPANVTSRAMQSLLETQEAFPHRIARRTITETAAKTHDQRTFVDGWVYGS
jgi:hypothetical protein